MIDLEELGTWIDGLKPEAKLRIREAAGWGYSGVYIPPDQRYGADRLCIVDHAEGRPPAQTPSWIHTYDNGPAEWFDDLCGTFGLELVVAACKARASA